LAFIHPARPGHPQSPGARSGTLDERKAGTGPLCQRENTQTLQSGRKSPSPSPRCSVAAGPTPRQSASQLPELRRPSTHQPIFHRLACRLAIYCRPAKIHPKCIYFPEHFRYCFSSNLCVLNTTNTD
jgi:hypothetical protein